MQAVSEDDPVLFCIAKNTTFCLGAKVAGFAPTDASLGEHGLTIYTHHVRLY
jgi:hypothetical protein